jgi:SAM-dependent methyltransferase
MTKRTIEKPHYGNWVSMKVIFVCAITTIFFAGCSVLFRPFIAGAVICLIPLIYLAYSYYKFSGKGGDLQSKIRGLVLEHLDWDGEGRAIDIGCGNGALTIEAAKKYRNIQIIGIDYWSSRWDYSKQVCEKNASAEGVGERTTFQKASASALPFGEEYFDLAISNLVFHEVTDTGDKREVIREALRVVKPGGQFAFQDLFLSKKRYGEIDDLLEVIKRWGIRKVEFTNTSKESFIPNLLRPQFMIGSIGIIHGIK